MLSKNKIKFIQSLNSKKNRTKNQLFIAEGIKIVTDLIESDFIINELFYTKDHELPVFRNLHQAEIVEETDYKKLSLLKTPPGILATVKIPNVEISWQEISNSLSIVLDDIQDPGNLGTIIRVANWFGIKNIICSHYSVDVYNPKTVQATMGSLSGVKIHYQNLFDFINKARKYNIPVYGTYLEGENIYAKNLTKNGLIVLGNESNGISKELGELIENKIHIPSYNQDSSKTDSLNIAIAASLTCAEFRRQNR